MNQPNFSVVLIGRNESKTLPRLLESLKEFKERGGEIVYCDTGSTDGTPDVARSAGCKVTEAGERFITTIDLKTAKKINNKFIIAGEQAVVQPGDRLFDFSSARNFAATLASNDVIATPDCDEAYTKLDIDKVNDAIEKGVEQLEYQFVYAHKPDGKPAIQFLHCKFYDRRKLKWTGVVHEILSGNARKQYFTEDIIFLEHYQNAETNRSKYLTGLAYDCYVNPINDRNSHYFARELFWTGRPKSAIREFERHIKMNAWAPERAQSHVWMGHCQKVLGNPEKAEELFLKAFAVEPTRRIGFIEAASLAFEKHNANKVAAYATAALQIPWDGYYSNDQAIFRHVPHEMLYWALSVQGKREEADKHVLKCLEYEPDNGKFLHDWRFTLKQPKVSVVIPTKGRPEKLKRLLKGIKDCANYSNYDVTVVHDCELPLPDEKDYLGANVLINPVRQGAPKTLKRGVEETDGELVMFLGNDCIPRPNFMVQAVMQMFPDMKNLDPTRKLVGLNDEFWHGELATHWLAQRDLLPFLGGEFFHTGYHHNYCDNELTERSRKLGFYSWCEKARIHHDHPNRTNYSEMDEVHKLAMKPDDIKEDYALITRRSAELGFNFSFNKSLVGCSTFEHGKEKPTELCALAEKYKSDKCPAIFHNYTPKYDSMFKGIRHKVMDVLEIGIGTPKTMDHVKEYSYGASLYMWRDYFPNSIIYGIDIDPKAMFEAGRIRTSVCDQSSPEQLEAMAKLNGPFDIIIDDGSHRIEHQATSFKALIGHLSDTGTYVIEDIMEPDRLIALISDNGLDLELHEFDLKFSQWDRMLVIRKHLPALKFTGERVVPDAMKGHEETLNEHMARYKWAAQNLGTGWQTADMACGTGYGSSLMSASRPVWGYDISQESVNYAKAHYPEVNFTTADLNDPQVKGKFDAVVSFETIEHLDDPIKFLEWVRDHALTMVFSIPIDRWDNPFHKRKYDSAQIMELMGKYFSDIQWFSQNGEEIKDYKDGDEPMFMLGIANN